MATFTLWRNLCRLSQLYQSVPGLEEAGLIEVHRTVPQPGKRGKVSDRTKSAALLSAYSCAFLRHFLAMPEMSLDRD